MNLSPQLAGRRSQLFLIPILLFLVLPSEVLTASSLVTQSHRDLFERYNPGSTSEDFATFVTFVDSERSGVNFDLVFAVVLTETEMKTESFYQYRVRNMNNMLYRLSEGPGQPIDEVGRISQGIREAIEDKGEVQTALSAYWSDPETGYNKGSVSSFVKKVLQKTDYLQGIKQEESFVRKGEIKPERFAPPEKESGTIGKVRMPKLDSQLMDFTNQDQYKEVVKFFNPKLKDDEALLIAKAVLTFSHQSGIDPRLIMAVLAVESKFKPRAVSRKGAMGLGQIMPFTAKSHGIKDAFEPVQNIYVTVKYLAREMERWDGAPNRLDLVLAAYNAGPNAVKNYGGVPPYNETVNYIKKVKQYYKHFSKGK